MDSISFSDSPPEPSVDFPREDRRIAGGPRRQTWLFHEDPASGGSFGIWACEVGHWRIEFAPDKSELFHVLEGRCAIRNADGVAKFYGPGDTCVIPPGFSGSFEVIEPIRKIFALAQRA
jgi:uncharacterized cupin superfamily protein